MKNKLQLFLFIFLFVFIAFTGLITLQYFSNIAVFCLLIFILLIILLVYLFIQNKHLIYLIIILLLSGSSGILFSHYTNIQYEQNRQYLSKYTHGNHLVSGRVLSLDKVKETKRIYILQVDNIDNNPMHYNINTLVSVPANYTLKIGDYINYNSKVGVIESNKDFNFSKYYAIRDIYFRSQIYTFDYLSSDETGLMYHLDNYRMGLLEIIAKMYPNEEKIFLGGILLGARENIPEELSLHFNRSGLTHLIAVSGFNITLLIVFLSFFIKFLPFWFRNTIVFVVIILFCLFVGLSPPVIRAGIMGVLGYIIYESGRQKLSGLLICITAFIMIVFGHAYMILYDVSFQLSFLALIGIYLLSDFFNKILYFIPNFLSVREAIVLTLSAMFFTFPLSVFNFGIFAPIWAPIANVMVAWTIPIGMLLGAVSIIISYIYLPFAYLIAKINWLILKYDIMMVHFFGTREFGVYTFEFGPEKYIYEFQVLLGLFSLVFLVHYMYYNKKRSN